MNKPLTPSTYVRSLNVGLIRKLSDFIDPQEGWKKLAVAIKKPSGDDRRFEALLQTGKSPTCELLFDWGTTNCTVGDLVDLLIQIELFAPATLLLPGFHSFSFYELKSITNNFDERPVSVGGNRMGEGGFGVVYKGCVNNTTVAVKKLGAMVEISTEELKQQFDQEIKVMANANILLDKDFTAKISDFGLARASAKFTQTVMTSRIVGTTAYMAPEALRGEITPKSDIYSFGVVLLELITGLAAVDENREPQLLLDIKDEIEDEEKTIEDYTDEKMNDTDPASVEAMYAAASQCLHEKKNKRPDITKIGPGDVREVYSAVTLGLVQPLMAPLSPLWRMAFLGKKHPWQV
ncbi:interleukin-1 receptor-associated kinase 4 [Cricetulus griseus]